MNEQKIVDLVKKGIPFDGMSDIRIVDVRAEYRKNFFSNTNIRPDVVITLDFVGTLIKVYGEVKTQVTPKILEQLHPWFARFRSIAQQGTFVFICPYLSPRSQQYCQKNNIDFIDLCGNVLIRVPGKLLIQRLNRPNIYKENQIYRNPFGGASSRVIRVLLQLPGKTWTVTEIEKELEQESKRQKRKDSFKLSISSISKTIRALQEELLVRRRNLKIIVADPRQLLYIWAKKYKERFKWMRKSSWTSKNPFSLDVESSIRELNLRFEGLDALVSGSAATNFIAPFVDIDRIDLFILNKEQGNLLLTLNDEQGIGPGFLFIYPYDIGVSMYSRKIKKLAITSNIQMYLDCYARGGRDAKQADYLLSNIIEKQWKST